MKPGQHVHQFTLEEKLGEGGAGVVWRAKHNKLNKSVAIKILHPQLASNLQMQQDFFQEAQIMSHLEHPNILNASDCFTEDGLTCLVMPYVDGGSLADLIDKRGKLPLNQAKLIMSKILDALDFAHRHGIIHRDVKPSNILINEDAPEKLKVTDFGIAKIMGEKRYTETRTFKGTIEYMSPEQIKTPKSIDHKADVYSCGCLYYELLTGQPPFGGRNEDISEFEIMQGHVNEKPRPLRDLNPEVDAHTEAVVLRALAKNPDDRYGGCKAMQLDLLGDDEEPPVVLTKPTKPGIKIKKSKRKEHISIAIYIIIIVVFYLLTIVISI